jgi:hypothetical protein
VDSYTAHATERVGAPHHFGRLPLFACFPTGNRPVRIRMPWWCGGRLGAKIMLHLSISKLLAQGPVTLSVVSLYSRACTIWAMRYIFLRISASAFLTVICSGVYMNHAVFPPIPCLE